MRLIDADALLDFTQMIAGIKNECSFETFQYAVEHARTIEAEQVRHGHWVKHPVFDDFDICSACGTGCRLRIVEYGWLTEYGYPRCPHCGAKMDGTDTDVHTREVSE